MEDWIAGHWLDLLQTIGIVGGLFFTAYAVRKDERARKISNLIAAKQQYREIWEALYENPKLFRVLKTDVDLENQPVADDEWLFVKFIILNLDTIYRAMNMGMFVKLEGLQKDVREFFSAPIPIVVWGKLKPLQDQDFAAFVEKCFPEN